MPKETNSIPAKSVKTSQVVMTELVLPTHTNALGTIFGGVIVSWIDIAAAVCAQRHSNKVVVTASLDQMNFIAPAYTGWVINLKASVNMVSTTSMEIGVRVDAENPMMQHVHHLASAYLTFVALDQKRGKPTPVPPLLPETADEKRRQAEAQERRRRRLQYRPQKT